MLREMTHIIARYNTAGGGTRKQAQRELEGRGRSGAASEGKRQAGGDEAIFNTSSPLGAALHTGWAVMWKEERGKTGKKQEQRCARGEHEEERRKTGE